MFSGRTYWIAGASDGLGAELAKRLDAEGAKLILSARRADRLSDLCCKLRQARALPMDVTDSDSVRTACMSTGPIDGVIYCVGQYVPMRTQDWDPEESVRISDANFTGALRLLGNVVPKMAERGCGHIVMIGSLAGFTGLPGAIGYGASKAALMHLAENMQADLRQTGVTVQCINPGFISTRLTAQNQFAMPQIMTPEAAAGRVIAAMRRSRFSCSFPAPFAWLFTLSSYVPRAAFLRVMGGSR